MLNVVVHKSNQWALNGKAENKKALNNIKLPYFPAYKTHRHIRRTMIFFVRNFRKKNDECILILVIYWKKTVLLHVLLQESKPFTSSDARSHYLEADFIVSR
jgi:hypothetical protein